MRLAQAAPDALVIGAGPAGLMAAEALAGAGHSVIVAEAKPSPARKFLMAGKSGLNLTKSEEMQTFLAAYGAGAKPLHPALRAFGPEAVQAWAQGLGQPLFTGTTGRIFPQAMRRRRCCGHGSRGWTVSACVSRAVGVGKAGTATRC